MRRAKAKNKQNKSVPPKTPKSSRKTIQGLIKKIRSAGKKIADKPKNLKTPPLEKLVLKASFVKPVVASDRQAPSPIFSASPPDPHLPAYYAENGLVLLVRDPWWLFAFWEVTPGREAEVKEHMAQKGFYRDKTILRIYDVTPTSTDTAGIFFDIEINHLNSNWYVDVGSPHRKWVAEIGFKTQSGDFFMLVRSNVVQTPPFGISDVLDEEWMMPDEMYFKLLGVMGGFESSGGSLSVRKLVEKYVRQSISSESSSQLSKPEPSS